MIVPNILGMRIISSAPVANRISSRVARVSTISVPTRTRIVKKSKFIQDVDVLVDNFNSQAFLYDSGKVDIKKKEGIRTIKFRTKKDAALYLMKAGWKFV